MITIEARFGMRLVLSGAEGSVAPAFISAGSLGRFGLLLPLTCSKYLIYY